MERERTVFVLNGANLNMLGVREPEVYGSVTLPQIRDRVEAWGRANGMTTDFRQSNAEADIINWLHEAHEAAVGVVLNPGGFTRQSIAILDAVKAIAPPVIELHLSNTHRRESFKPPSWISHGARAVICGFGAPGYTLALDGLLDMVAKTRGGKS